MTKYHNGIMRAVASGAQAASLASIFANRKKVMATAIVILRILSVTHPPLKAIAGNFRSSTAVSGVENTRPLSKYP
jgi:hypothetical protein